ncbi:MAG: PEP-CTERM sorting domain-containing protein [Zoogloea sp.]|nr:PEP-CTERM sorting domain-containing protein [Zoogloea sp.]
MKKHLLALALIAAAGGANAAVVSFSDSFGLATTDWSHNLSLQQFDATLGTLNSVTFNFGGQVSSIFRVESLDAAPATVNANASGNLIFGGPISQTLNISGSTSQAVTAFDGAIDFGGTSGAIIGPVVGTDSDSLSLISGLAAFIGSGTYDINVAAHGASSASGAGNLISQINTEAMANITVTYDYTARPPVTVPEPTSMALVGLGALGLAAIRRRK